MDAFGLALSGQDEQLLTELTEQTPFLASLLKLVLLLLLLTSCLLRSPKWVRPRLVTSQALPPFLHRLSLPG